MCFGNKTAKKQARIMEQQAKAQAANDAFAAQAAAASRENAIRLEQASKAAADLLAAPVERAEVSLSEETPVAEIDPNTRRRRTARSSFQVPRVSGINI